LINNAGIARGKTILDSSENDIRLTFDVNTLAHFWLAKEFLPDIAKKNHGIIVTIASVAGSITAPQMVEYAASKAAAVAFHEGLAVELLTRYNAPKVRTILVTPGFINTALFTGWKNKSSFFMPRLEPETVAEAIVAKVKSGTSGLVALPSTATNLMLGLRGWPLWLQLHARYKAEHAMHGFSGRQVFDDDGNKEATR